MQLDEVRRLLADLGAGLDDGLELDALADLMVSDDALVSPGYVGLAAFASVGVDLLREHRKRKSEGN